MCAMRHVAYSVACPLNGIGVMEHSASQTDTHALAGTCVVIPAYNEAGAIPAVMDDLQHLQCTTVVVDDGSTDGTYEMCLDYPGAVLRHATNLGQGAALQTGITYAVGRLKADYVVTFDADGQHRATDIPRLLEPLVDKGYEVALGTRFARRQDADTVPRGRRLVLRAAIVFTRLSSGLPVTDAHNGFRAFTAGAVRKLRIRHSGMAHASEILHYIHDEGLRWCEVPVAIDYTEYSKQKGQRSSGALDIMWDLVSGRLR